MASLKQPGLLYFTASRTHVGKVRRNNEDSVFIFDQALSGELCDRSLGLYIIADGMGGHQAGEIASEIATRVVSETVLANFEGDRGNLSPTSLVIKAIEKANREIYRLAGSKPELFSMGTTITVGLRVGDDLYIGHVGDSRAYLVRGQVITQLTKDHSVIAYLLKDGIITREEAKTHPDRGMILRCLGLSARVNIDTYIGEAQLEKLGLLDNDYLVFCSDGLTGNTSDDEILSCVRKNQTPDKICEKLVDLANARGGDDNISVIVVKASATNTLENLGGRYKAPEEQI